MHKKKAAPTAQPHIRDPYLDFPMPEQRDVERLDLSQTEFLTGTELGFARQTVETTESLY